jgi:hypothetical protein
VPYEFIPVTVRYPGGFGASVVDNSCVEAFQLFVLVIAVESSKILLLVQSQLPFSNRASASLRKSSWVHWQIMEVDVVLVVTCADVDRKCPDNARNML